MLQRRAFVAALPLLPAAAAQPPALPPEVGAELPGAQLLGSGRLRFVGFTVYDARLFARAPLAADGWAQQPLALTIDYARAFEGMRIAERTLAEMRRQADFDDTTAERWRAELQAILPDVRAGDRLTGVQRPGEATRFHFNGRARGELRDALFTKLFFGIWLSPRTSEPSLRDALLGGAS